MKQKLVIRTNVKPVAAAQSVSYDWHWRRIWAVLLSFVVIIGAGAYALQLSVNADEAQEVQVASLDEAQLAMAYNGTEAINRNAGEAYNEEADPAAEALNDSATDHQTETISQDVTKAYSEEHETAVAHDELLAADEITETILVNIEEAYSEELRSATAETPPLSDDNIRETLPIDVSEADEAEPSSTTEVVSQKQFAQDANVANVALGAKIDTGKISRAVLTTRVVDKEPVDVLKSDVSNTQFNEKIYFFTEVKNLQGNIIHHLWYYQDVLQADIALTISAARYRTYSLKHIHLQQTGDWRVEAVTENGDLLAKKEFRIHAAKP